MGNLQPLGDSWKLSNLGPRDCHIMHADHSSQCLPKYIPILFPIEHSLETLHEEIEPLELKFPRPTPRNESLNSY